MARMLEALDFAGGERVLEIGTGTGYNAALLCAGLGSELVTSVDTDPSLADSVQSRLRELGYAPALAVGDGADGCPGAAPFDRIIATCSLPRVPAAWLAQAAPGAVIIVNLYRELGGGALAVLRVAGGRASGRFASFCGGFMPTRTVPAVPAVPAGEIFGLVSPHLEDPGERRPATVPAAALADDAFDMLAALLLPGVHRVGVVHAGQSAQTWLAAADGSWACQEEQDVRQGGPRRLWDDLEALHREWSARGRPARDQIGLTVTADGGHQIWTAPGQNADWPI